MIAFAHSNELAKKSHPRDSGNANIVENEVESPDQLTISTYDKV